MSSSLSNQTYSKRQSLLAFALPLLLILLLFLQFRIADGAWKHVIASDGKGYYHYLVEYFIDAPTADEVDQHDFLIRTQSGYYNKYPMGTAFLLLPFFAAAYIASVLSGEPIDGYSFPFQFFAGLGALVYLVFGAFFLFRLLRSYGASALLCYAIVLAAIFGSNLIYYGVVASTMSHVYSFFAVTAFAYSLRLFFLSGHGRMLVIAAFFMALILLIRPFNALVILAAPLLFADRFSVKMAIATLLHSGKYLLLALLLCMLIASLQIGVWFDQSGDLVLYSYSDEGFYFSDPQLVPVLFSFNKGLFVYAPMVALSIFGALYGMWKFRAWAWYFLAFFGLLSYAISSWWCWNYASGFGLRPFIDYYGLFCIPAALALQQLSVRTKAVWAALAVAFTLLNLVQSYQYRFSILHPNNMDAHKYVAVFMKTGHGHSQSLGGNFDLPPYPKQHLRLIDELRTGDEDELLRQPYLFTQEYAPGEIVLAGGQLFWEMDMEKSDMEQGASERLYFVVHYTQGDSTTFYQAFRVNDLPEYPVDAWVTHQHSLVTPMPHEGDNVKCYIWNQHEQPLHIRTYHLRLWAPAQEP